MDSRASWKTPFLRQCFATLGVTLSTTGDACVISFTSVLLPQLRQSEDIILDEERESWIASIVGMSLIVGILIVPSIMGTFGRRTANSISTGILAVTWLALAFSADYHTILFIRFLQGLSIGMTAILASITIAEYTSPKYRGAFLTTIAMSYSLGMLTLHILALFFNWMQISLIFAGTTLLDCIIIMCSPETPSFLATRGRYDECRKAFHWLRYPDEEEELEKMIKANMSKFKIVTQASNLKEKLWDKFNYLSVMVRKEEFYKPLIVMFHLHIINEWSASNLVEAYTSDIFAIVVGSDVNAPLLMIFTDVFKVITNIIAVVLISKVKRRVMLLGTILLNILSFLLTAGHVYAKTHGVSTFDYPIVGIVLIHFHVFTLAIGSLPLPNIISGEIFALEYRSILSVVTMLFFCINMIVNMKTALFLFSKIGLHGAYLMYGAFVSYGLLVAMIMLPETKDRTLQDIEEDFRGRNNMEELQNFIQQPDIALKSRICI